MLGVHRGFLVFLVLLIVLSCLVRVLVLVMGFARPPWAAEHARALSPLLEEAADALVGDGEEVFLGVGVRLDEVLPAARGGGEESGAGRHEACELRCDAHVDDVKCSVFSGVVDERWGRYARSSRRVPGGRLQLGRGTRFGAVVEDLAVSKWP